MDEHKSRAHALLSASGSSRWINCTPSPRLEEKFPSSTSKYAEEGTLAHELSELKLRLRLGEITRAKYDTLMEGNDDFPGIYENPYYSEEMEIETDKYVDYVLEQYAASQRFSNGKSTIILEEKIDLTDFIQDGFGTSDSTIADPEILEVIDLKYGKGVRVDAKDNSQLKLYGLGSLIKNELLYGFKKVKLTIVQPRLDAISSWEIPVEELIEWGEKIVKPKAEMAHNGEGEQNPGDWCKWCRAKSSCKALKDLVFQEAAIDFKQNEDGLLTDEEVIESYGKIEMIQDWINGLKDFVLSKALNGKKWPGYKLVEGRSTRIIANKEEFIEELKTAKIKKSEFIKESVRGIGELEKNLVDKKGKTILQKFLIKPSGAPTLVPMTDKREEWNSAKSDFS